MKLAQIITLLWAVACGYLTAQTTVAYEGFDYLKGGCLAGGATGDGWAGPWGVAGESGNVASELVLGPGSFPVPPGFPAASGHHVDLNYQTGERRITRRLSSTLGGGSPEIEYKLSFVLDLGPAAGVDYAGIELSHSDGGPVVFLGKPPGPGPSSQGILGIDIYGQGFTGTGVAGSGQKLVRLRWWSNTLTLEIRDAVTGGLLGGATRTAIVSFNQITLVARRDLAAGGAIPAFDEILATSGPVEMRLLTVSSMNSSEGVPVSISPADIHGDSSGTTDLTRSYPAGSMVTVTAPSSANGSNFVKWTLNGSDHSVRQAITISMAENRSLTAVYQVAVRTLSVAATGSDGPVNIAVSPSDNQQLVGGVAPLSRLYASGTLVSLIAPATVADSEFRYWEVDGSIHSEKPSTQVMLNTNTQIVAVYDYPLDEAIQAILVESDRILLTWSAVGGRSYRVEASDDLRVFLPVSPWIEASGDGRTVSGFQELLSPIPAKRFYRIRIGPP